MITKKHTYTGEDKKAIEKYYKELSKEAQWIGEDGNATCVATTARGAMIKFRRLMREDVGEIEAREMKEDEVGGGSLILVDKDDKNLDGEILECDWYVSYSGKDVSDYRVYVYNA